MELPELLLQLERLTRPSQQQQKQAAKKGIRLAEQQAAALELWQQNEGSIRVQRVWQLKQLSQLLHLLGEHDKAGQLLKRWTDSLLQPLDNCEQQQAQIELLLSEAEYLKAHDRKNGLQALHKACELLRNLPIEYVRKQKENPYYDWHNFQPFVLDNEADNLDSGWEDCFNLAEVYQDWQLALQITEWAFAQQQALYPDNHWSERCWGKLNIRLYQIKIAEKIHPDIEQAKAYRKTIIEQAITELAALRLEYRLMSHWIALAKGILNVYPEAMRDIAQSMFMHIPAPKTLPEHSRRNYYQSHIDEFLAKACIKCGDIVGALTIAKQWPIHDRHIFKNHLLHWLIRGKHWQQATEYALYSALFDIQESSAQQDYYFNHTFNLLRKVDGKVTTDAQAAIDLLFAWRLMHPRLKQSFKAPPYSIDEYLAKAREQRPNWPLSDLLQGWHLAHEMHFEQALPLLEKSIKQLPEIGLSAPADFIIKLWCARFATLSSEKALQRPWPLPASARSCYFCAQQLEDERELCIEQGGSNYGKGRFAHCLPPEPIRPQLSAYYYQATLDYLDEILTHPKKCLVDLEYYNLCCLALAQQQYKARQYEKALSFYQKALENHDHWFDICQAQIKCCLIWYRHNGTTKAAQALLASAEQAWQFFNKNPAKQDKSGKLLEPSLYFVALAKALAELNRPLEIIIWLDRLQQWHEVKQRRREQNDQSEPSHKRTDRLRTLLGMLTLLAPSHPEPVRPILQAAMPEITASNNPELQQCAAKLL